MRQIISLQWTRRAVRTIGIARILAALTLLALVPRPATAGPPFITDDPEPVGLGHGEFYIASQNTWSAGDFSGTLPHFEYNYGPTPDTQLHLITPLVYDQPRDTDRFQYGYGDTELGVKWRFVHADEFFPGCPEVGTFPLLELPSGDVHRGLGNGRAQEFIPIWLQRNWGPAQRPWSLYGGGGYEFNPGPGNENFGFFGAVLQKQVTDNLALGVEAFHFTPSGRGLSGHTGINLGGVYDFSDHWHLLFSVGRDIQGDDRLIDYLAIQYTF
jgi:hypothetical protein